MDMKQNIKNWVQYKLLVFRDFCCCYG